MADTIRGEFEIYDPVTQVSRTVTGTAIDPDQAAVVLAAVEGLTDIEAVDPEPVGETLPVGQWTATDTTGRAVVVKLWRELELLETSFGQALAAALGGGTDE